MRTQRTPCGFLKIFALCLAAQFFSSLSAAPDSNNETVRVFLAGNSILYTNNLPAILTEIGTTNGKQLTVDMFARGGARVSDLLANTKVISAIRNGAYDVVVFHDRGGDALCAASHPEDFEPECREMIEAHRRLAELVRDNGAVPYLLGTYQPPTVSLWLTQGEQYIANTIDVPHIEISEKWNRVREVVIDAQWLAEDGMHPGKALSTLMAAEIYRTLFSAYPLAADITTTAPLFVPRNRLDDVVALDALPAGEAKKVITAEQFERMLAVLRSTEGAD